MKCGNRFRSCMARRILFTDGLLVVMQILSMPAFISASASLSLAAQRPIAPAAICSFAMAAHLCVLACGRVAMPFRLTVACIFAMFASNRVEIDAERRRVEIPLRDADLGRCFGGHISCSRIDIRGAGGRRAEEPYAATRMTIVGSLEAPWETSGAIISA